jgi:PilZ domain
VHPPRSLRAQSSGAALVPIRREVEALSEGEQQAKTINISTRGVYFTTNLVLHVGEAVELHLEMPKRVTGAKVSSRRFTGRVTHVVLENMPMGLSGIGVQLLYDERDLVEIASKRL